MNDKIRCKNVNKVKLEMNLEVFWIRNLQKILHEINKNFKLQKCFAEFIDEQKFIEFKVLNNCNNCLDKVN